MKRALPFVIIALVLGAALSMFLYFQHSTVETPSGIAVVGIEPGRGEAPGASPSRNATNRSATAEPGAEPPHAQGSPNAPVTLEEYGDFQCPPCGMLHPVLKNLEAEFGPEKLRIIFREFPLVPAHAHALAAARAAEAAGLQGKFWEMHGMLYENQRVWHEAFDVRPTFEGYATKIGLDLEQFRRDISGPIVERRIFLDGKRAHDLGVKGTPTVFLNGREVPFESLAPEKLKALISSELARQ